MDAIRRLAARVAGVAAALALAACGGNSPVRKDKVDPGDLDAIASSGPSVADVLARGNDTVAAQPAPVAFDHIGDWAKSAAACGGDARWRFTAGAVDAGGGSRCAVTGSEAASADAKTLTLACTAEGIKTIERWSLVRHEDGGMTVARSEGGNGVPVSVTLRRCG